MDNQTKFNINWLRRIGKMERSLMLHFCIFAILANAVFSQPFGPPLFIANPETLECRYYFAGNEKHFNPRPENYTENIGYTTEFKDKDQACGVYICVKTAGRILLASKDDANPKLCECPLGTFWNNETGCTAGINPATEAKEQDKKNIFSIFIRLLNWIISLFR